MNYNNRGEVLEDTAEHHNKLSSIVAMDCQKIIHSYFTYIFTICHVDYPKWHLVDVLIRLLAVRKT